jgi:hypothetical protein
VTDFLYQRRPGRPCSSQSSTAALAVYADAVGTSLG